MTPINAYILSLNLWTFLGISFGNFPISLVFSAVLPSL